MIALMWKESRALTATVAIMLLDFAMTLIAMAFDPRLIGGVAAWLKPAKFAVSAAIFAGSIAWLFRHLPDFPKMKRFVGPALAAVLAIEVGLIDVQAWRGTKSHFNVSTPENAAVYAVMGISIAVLWLLSVWILVNLFQQRFDDEAWGRALRMGLLINVLGSATGGLMTQPTNEQRAAIAEHRTVAVVGAHTVGAPDGGAGLPGTGWSREHGDLRIPHFMGMHALQIIPLLVWLRRKRTTRFVFVVAGSYAIFCAILFWQALRGESIAEPGRATLAALGVWLAATAGALVPWQRNGYRMDALNER